MDTKKFITGTLVGGVVYFFLGFLFYAVLFEDFFQSNMGSATGVQRIDDMVWWALILGNLASAALLSFIFLKWAGIRSFGEGAQAGAIIAFLYGLTFDMILYATTNMMNLVAAFADVAVFTVMSALAGGVIGWVLGRGEPAETT